MWILFSIVCCRVRAHFILLGSSSSSQQQYKISLIELGSIFVYGAALAGRLHHFGIAFVCQTKLFAGRAGHTHKNGHPEPEYILYFFVSSLNFLIEVPSWPCHFEWLWLSILYFVDKAARQMYYCANEKTKHLAPPPSLVHLKNKQLVVYGIVLKSRYFKTIERKPESTRILL